MKSALQKYLKFTLNQWSSWLSILKIDRIKEDPAQGSAVKTAALIKEDI